jgi:hypothetical protein
LSTTGLGLLLIGVAIDKAYINQQMNAGVLIPSNSPALLLVVSGLALEIASVAIVVPARKNHLHKSIDQYNSKWNNTGQRPVRLELMTSSDGLGVRLKF